MPGTRAFRTRPALLGAIAGALACSEYGVGHSAGNPSAGGPDIAVDPTSLAFGAQPLGSVTTKQLRVMEAGFALLTVHDLWIDRPGGFSLPVDVAPFQLEAGQAKLVEVAYGPVSESDVADLIIASDDPDEPELRIPLHGTSQGGALRWEPDPYDFGVVASRTTTSGEVDLVNDGPVPVTVDGMLVLGANFSLPEPPAFPLVVMPGTRQPVEVAFSPDVPDEVATGEIVAATDLGSGDVSGALLGTGGETLTGELELVFEVSFKVADVAFLLDTTCSMSGLASSMASEYADIAGDVIGEIPDVTFGVATYDDYNESPFGSGADLPFRLEQQQTSDTALVQAVLATIGINGGGDGPESSMEALAQALTGTGYDQDCDGTLDTVTDVPPFVPGAGDAFGGTAAGLFDGSIVGTGSLGGMGFRDDTLPIVIYATDNELRDPENGYGSPGGCPQDAGQSDVVNAVAGLDARLIAVGVNLSAGETAWEQMVELANLTGSSGDMDGDGVSEPAVVEWSGTSADFRKIIVDAITGLASTGEFATISLEEISDPDDVVLSISPTSYVDVKSGDALTFTLEVVGDVLDAPTDTSSTAVLRLTDGVQTLETRLVHVQPW